MKIVYVDELNGNLDEFLEQVRNGAEIIVKDRNRSADLVLGTGEVT